MSATRKSDPIEPGPRLLRPRDLMLSAGVLAVQLVGTHAISRHRGTSGHGWWAASAVTHLDALGYALLCVGPLALLAKRAYPRAVLAFVFAITVAYAAIGYPAGPVFLSLIVAFAVVVNRGYRGVGIACIVSGWVLFLCLPWVLGTGGRPTVPEAVGLAAWLLVLLAATRSCAPGVNGPPRCTAASSRRDCARRRRSGCGSHASCTTCSPTTSR